VRYLPYGSLKTGNTFTPFPMCLVTTNFISRGISSLANEKAAFIGPCQ